MADFALRMKVPQVVLTSASEVDDIVRSAWRHAEAGRNDRLDFKQEISVLPGP